MAAVGMNLRKWNSNSPELIQKIESATAAAPYTNSSGGNVKEEDETHVKAVMDHSILKTHPGFLGWYGTQQGMFFL